MFAGRWPCDTVTKQPQGPPSCQPHRGGPTRPGPPHPPPPKLRETPEAPRGAGTRASPWQWLRHPTMGTPQDSPRCGCTRVARGQVLWGLMSPQPDTLAFPARQLPVLLPPPTGGGHPTCDTRTCRALVQGHAAASVSPSVQWVTTTASSHVLGGCMSRVPTAPQLQSPPTELPTWGHSSPPHPHCSPAQPPCPQTCPHQCPPVTAAPSATQRGDKEEGEELAAPSPSDTGVSRARCQYLAAHTQALPPAPPNSRATWAAHAVAQPRPTAPFIFRLLQHSFPAAHPKDCRGTQWAMACVTPCPAPAPLRATPCTSCASVSPSVTFAHQPC